LSGAANAAELKKIAAEGVKGVEPEILDYTYPVINKGNGEKEVDPAGKRAYPGLAGPGEAAVTGSPAKVLGNFTPEISVPLQELTGKNFYTGENIDEPFYKNIAKETLSFLPGARFLHLNDLGEEKSGASKTFSADDPNKAKRSYLSPLYGQSGKDFAKELAFGHHLDTKYGEGHLPEEIESKVFERLNNGEISKRKAEQIIHEAEEAGDLVKKEESKVTGGKSDWGPKSTEDAETVENAWESGPDGKKKGTLEKIEEEAGLSGSKSVLSHIEKEVGLSGSGSTLEHIEEEAGLK